MEPVQCGRQLEASVEVFVGVFSRAPCLCVARGIVVERAVLSCGTVREKKSVRDTLLCLEVECLEGILRGGGVRDQLMNNCELTCDREVAVTASICRGVWRRTI